MKVISFSASACSNLGHDLHDQTVAGDTIKVRKIAFRQKVENEVKVNLTIP